MPALKRSELEIACEDFSNIIGSLSDCKLYKGTLSSGVEIAVVSTLVASAKSWSKQSESNFRKKVLRFNFFYINKKYIIVSGILLFFAELWLLISDIVVVQSESQEFCQPSRLLC